MRMVLSRGCVRLAASSKARIVKELALKAARHVASNATGARPKPRLAAQKHTEQNGQETRQIAPGWLL